MLQCLCYVYSLGEALLDDIKVNHIVTLTLTWMTPMGEGHGSVFVLYLKQE